MVRPILRTVRVLGILAAALHFAPAWAACEAGSQPARVSCLTAQLNKVLATQAVTEAEVRGLQADLADETARGDALEQRLAGAEARLLVTESDVGDAQSRLDAHDIDLETLFSSSAAVDAALALMEAELGDIGSTLKSLGDPFAPGWSSTGQSP